MTKFLALLATAVSISAYATTDANNAANTNSQQPAAAPAAQGQDQAVTQQAAAVTKDEATAGTAVATITPSKPLPLGVSFVNENTVAPEANKGDENKISSIYYGGLTVKFNKFSLTGTQPVAREWNTFESSEDQASRESKGLQERTWRRQVPYVTASYPTGEFLGFDTKSYIRQYIPVKSTGLAIEGRDKSLDTQLGTTRVGISAGREYKQWSLSVDALAQTVAVKQRGIAPGKFNKYGGAVLATTAQYNFNDKIAVGPNVELIGTTTKRRVIDAAGPKEARELIKNDLTTVFRPAIISVSPLKNVGISAYPSLTKSHQDGSNASWDASLDLSARF